MTLNRRCLALFFLLRSLALATGAVTAKETAPATTRVNSMKNNYNNNNEKKYRRRLSQENILDYMPLTTVVDDAAIDLDQQLMENELQRGTKEGLENAYFVYTKGAFTQSFATLTLDYGVQLPVPAQTDVTGLAADGRFVRGKTLEPTPAGSMMLNVSYHVNPVQSLWTECHVGGNPTPVLDRCFASEGTLEIDQIGTFTYKYDPSKENYNQQTLQTLSTDIRKDEITRNKTVTSSTFAKYFEYYGQLDYGNQWILAAFHKTATHDFLNGHGNFFSYTDEGVVGEFTVYYFVVCVFICLFHRRVVLFLGHSHP